MLNGPTGITMVSAATAAAAAAAASSSAGSTTAAPSIYFVDSGNSVVRQLQFLHQPVVQRSIGDVTTILWREWTEWQERTGDQRKRDEIRAVKLERQLLEQRKELQEYKRSVVEEFAKVRLEAMQMQRQFLSSMQNMQQ